MNYYNEKDPNAAAWIRNLIVAGHIPLGVVDERSIEDVHPGDLRGFTQCHFFAGVAVWSRALRVAGWPSDRPVWTGSCPCQPFSAAGAGRGFADERHLWPAWFHLIRRAKPRDVPVFGEQVASNDGLAWLDVVSADLEAAGYAVGSADLCAAGFGAPHIRQRLYFVAHPEHGGRAVGQPEWAGAGAVVPSGAADWLADGADGGRPQSGSLGDAPGRAGPVRNGGAGGLGHSSSSTGLALGIGDGRVQREALGAHQGETLVGGSDAGRVADDHDDGRQAHGTVEPERAERDVESRGAADGPGPTNGHWAAADWLLCTDGRWRPVEPGTRPLAHGAPARVVRLRAYGNAIVEQVAAGWIDAYLKLRQRY